MKEVLLDDLSQLVNISLVDVLVKKIRNNIYLGKYAAGKKLVVRELSEEFGVSHTPIKDALNRLVAEGYVEALPRKSMIVKTHTNSELIDSLQARLMCEVFSAKNIIKEAKNDSLISKEMHEILQRMKKILSKKNEIIYEDWVINETAFHRCYMKHCGNSQIFKFYCELDTNKTSYLAYLDTEHKPLEISTLQSNLLEHQAIFEAIVKLDDKALIKSVKQHIIRACDDYVTDEECNRKYKLLVDVCKSI